VFRSPTRYGAVAAATPDDSTALPAQRWWRGPDPDPELVRRMLVDEGRTEVEIAAALGVSRARLAAALTELGVDRGGRVRRVCPVGDADLRVLLGQGATVAGLARRFGVAKVTVQCWLAGAGLLLPDPAVDGDALSRLYVEQGRTSREVAGRSGSAGPGSRWRWRWPASPGGGAPSGSPAAGGPTSPMRCCATCMADPR